MDVTDVFTCLFEIHYRTVNEVLTGQKGFVPGQHDPDLGIGKDDTLFALIDGKVKFERMGKDRKMCSVYAEQ